MVTASPDQSTQQIQKTKALLQRALNQFKQGRLQHAERLYKSVLALEPAQPHANHNLGMLALRQQRTAEGLAYLKRALDAEPTQGQWWLSYIEALFAHGKTDMAKSVLEEGISKGLAGDPVAALCKRLGVQARLDVAHASTTGPSAQEQQRIIGIFTARHYEQAAAEAEALTRAYPDHGFGWSLLGVALRQLDRLPEALPALSRAVELMPDQAVAASNLGVAQQMSGQAAAAELTLRRAIALAPTLAEAHCNLGLALIDLNRPREAEQSLRQALALRPEMVEAISNLGNALRAQGLQSEAEACYRQAIAIQPSWMGAHANLAALLIDSGRLDEAGDCLKAGLERDANSFDIHMQLGNLQRKARQIDQARASYERALQIRPGNAAALCNLANIFNRQGETVLAEAALHQSLRANPNLAEAHVNLGNIQLATDRTAEAETSFQAAASIKPSLADAYFGLAMLRVAANRPKEAMEYANRCLDLGETGEAKRLFAACIRRQDVSHIPSGSTRERLVRALLEPWSRPNGLASYVAGVLRQQVEIAQLSAAFEVTDCADLIGKLHTPSSSLATVLQDELLQALMVSTPVGDLTIERFLTRVRREILLAHEAHMNIGDAVGTIAFLSALAQQCFLNEYAFACTEEEEQALSSLRNQLTDRIDQGQSIEPVALLICGAYQGLNKIPGIARVLERPWTEPLLAVLTQQVIEPSQELALRGTIPVLTAIDDEVSLQVRQQYEENPYPRWNRVEAFDLPMTVDEFLRRTFPASSYRPMGIGTDASILIAGCGTGQHPIGTAGEFPEARLLAIDLSLSSLSYAKRKSNELGISNLEFAQGDIMRLGAFNQQFDVIESSGVLHHLADPWAGWRILLSLLKPNGVMRLGFYSEIARSGVVEARRFIAERGYGRTASEIRRCRVALAAVDDPTRFGPLLKLGDFYSISACRDLIFHVQEHRLTLPQIDGFLKSEGLAFLGFQMEPNTLQAYRRQFPQDEAATNLELWNQFEMENPLTFIGMYQFWIQKTSAPQRPES